MKNAIGLLLILAMVLSLLAGCGGAEAPEEQTPATTAPAPSTEATTAPTLSPEELLYNSLTDRQRLAVDLGIVELSQLEDPERVVTVGEACAMLQKAYVHRTGVESKTFNELMTREEYASRNAPRGWLIGMPGLADLELTHGDQYENYEQWFRLTGDNGGWCDLWAAFDKRFGIKEEIIPTDDAALYNANADAVFTNVFGSLPIPAPDYAEYDAGVDPNASDLLYHSLLEIVSYAFKICDSTNGKKFIELEDGYLHPYREITVAEMAEHALRYCNSPNPMAYPEYVAPEDVGTYNTDIITAELLAKDTDLPEASCEYLPAQWHGVVMRDLELLDDSLHLDNQLYEYEIKAVKDAGFNYICLNLDFSWLQDYEIFNLKNNASSAWSQLTKKEDDGKFSIERLEQLDQVVAWCMKYDIHLNLRVSAFGGFTNSHDQLGAVANGSKKLRTRLAQNWQAIARRYADIPNTYLSFTLINNFAFIQADMILPAVDAIRAESPERCLIAQIFGSGHLKPEPFAEKGVALSFQLEEPMAVLDHNDYYGVLRPFVNGLKDASVIDSFTWPYEGIDAETALNTRHYRAPSFNEVKAVAEEYGVGYMLGEFGINLRSTQNALIPRTHYPDDDYKAMIVDITSTVEEMGYGWCFANWYGYYGVANPIPIIKDTVYEQVEDYPYYIDQSMLSWFQEINGVA